MPRGGCPAQRPRGFEETTRGVREMSTIKERLERARRADVGGAVERAAARFREQAAGAGLLDIGYGWIDTPVGRLLGGPPQGGLVRVSLPSGRLDRHLPHP